MLLFFGRLLLAAGLVLGLAWVFLFAYTARFFWQLFYGKRPGE